MIMSGIRRLLGYDVRSHRGPRHWVEWHYQIFCFITGKQIRNLNYWLQYEVIEAYSTHTVTVKSLLHSPLLSSTSIYTRTVIVASCLKICVQFRCHFGLQTVSIRVPLVANHIFSQSVQDRTFLCGPDYE